MVAPLSGKILIMVHSNANGFGDKLLAFANFSELLFLLNLKMAMKMKFWSPARGTYPKQYSQAHRLKIRSF
jgi:hypothetical protein